MLPPERAAGARRFEDVSIIVPAHNEEHRIADRLHDLCSTVDGAEVIVVANNCSDGTEQIVHQLASLYGQLKLVTVPFGIGKGGAVRVGFQISKRPVVAFVDADRSTSASELCRLIERRGDADCLIASRWLPESRVEPKQNAFRRFASRAFNTLVRGLIGVRLSDTQCGAKIFARTAFERVAEHVETADFAFDVDLLFQFQRQGMVIREVPTVWSDCIGSSIRASSAIPRMFASLVRLRVRHSPLRLIVPAIDRILNLRPISTRRSLRVLVLSRHDPTSARATAAERRLYDLACDLDGLGRSFTWHHAGGSRAMPASSEPSRGSRLPLPLRYVSSLRDSFDCVVEIADERALWTPLFSLKPILVYAARTLPMMYRGKFQKNRMPNSASEFDEDILAATRRSQHMIARQNDGTWYVLDSSGLNARMLDPGDIFLDVVATSVKDR